MSAPRMTVDEALALPVTVNLPTAARAFGISPGRSYELARSGRFPCPVLQLGHRLVVTRSAILAALGVNEDAVSAVGEPRPTLATMAEVLEAVPDPVTRHLAAALIARLAELGSRGGQQ